MGWTFEKEDTANNTRLQIVTRQCNYTNEHSAHRVVYAFARGSTCYLAIRHTDLATGESTVTAAVVLTSIRNNNIYNFGVKYISEDMHPIYYDAPKKLISMLSPTENKLALEWREACIKQAEKQYRRNSMAAALRSLPVDSVIQVGDPCETKVVVYTFDGKRRYKIVDRWARLSTKYILNYGFQVVSTPQHK